MPIPAETHLRLRESTDMLLAALAVLVIATVPLAGGRLSRLADLRLRAVWALALALVVQVLIISVLPSGDVDLHRVLHLATYVAVLVWVVLNHGLLWRWPIVIGGALNFVVIVANDGVMPASRAARVAAGLVGRQGFENSAAVAHPNLGFLGDVFAIPADLPLANVFSVGDALLVLGIFLVVHRQCESYLAYRLARLGDGVRGHRRRTVPTQRGDAMAVS
ncbi:MAG: DUF5317 family protein [Acidimicrobiia bacterium]